MSKFELEPEFISIAGYGSTGSSAVVNLLEEVDSCFVVGGEFRFIQDPDGLDDFCKNISDSWGWVRSDAFVRRFIKYTDTLGRRGTPFSFGENLDQRFNHKFFNYRDQFLKSVIDTSWQGYWFYHDYHERNFAEVFIEKCKRYLKRFGVDKKTIRKITKKSEMYFVRHDVDVYGYAGEFIQGLFSELVLSESKSKFVLDQLVLPYNQDGFKKLFPGLKQIVVDRDPRDVYLDAMTYNAYPITEDIETFISFYTAQRSYRKEECDNTLFVKFEDLIFEYEETKSLIFQFLNIDPDCHKRRQLCFDPNVSKANVGTWRKSEFQSYREEIEYIETELCDWLYDV